MKTMTFSALATVAWLASASAFAQSSPSPAPVPPLSDGTPLPGGQAVVGGKDIQPQGVPDQKLTGSLAGVESVLRQDDTYGKESQAVQPRDLYGNPMGGDPGLHTPPVKPALSP
jgi:hypothetical protein